MQSAIKTESSGNWTYALFVSLVATLGGLLFGYDTAVVSGAIGFLEKFSYLSPFL